MTARRAGWTLAGVGLVAAGLLGTARAPAVASDVTARLGPITVSATALRLAAAGTLTADVRVTTSGRSSDQLDAAIADGVPAGVYHEVISLTDMPDDLASCGGAAPPSGVVQQWMHYGPLVVYGTSSGSPQPADARLTVTPDGAARPGGTVAVTLYFARAGSLVLRLPVSDNQGLRARPTHTVSAFSREGRATCPGLH
jgi:hypothetical protein